MFSIDVNTRPWLVSLDDWRAEQGPFVLKTALNTLATSVQDAERAHMRGIFTERRPEWLDRSVKITHFATKAEPWAIVGIHPPGGDARADIIGKFEDQTEKIPLGASIAIPVDARRSKKDIVLNSQRPNALRGNDKVFVIRKPNGVGLILQRISRGARKGTNRLLYLLVKRTRITPDLEFEATAIKTVDAKAVLALDAAFDLAMKTAK